MSGADLALILDAATAAAKRAQAVRRVGLTTTTKSDGTPVTNADLEVGS
jgi:3'-phosphoadenosine 5'-phosphosulfate (PAPS) 3'-phosphatase